jgi:hypothetical protein
MLDARRVAKALLAACVLACALPALAPASTRSGEAALMKALLRSRELWATIDVCDPSDQPDYVGVRGSMPGDKHKHDTMYMSFRLQVQTSAKNWVDLTGQSQPSFVSVGPGDSVRQDGQSFQLVPKPDKPTSTLRGVVEFQWRRGKTVLQSATRFTTAAHKSVSGADPAGYSAAQCLIA